MIFNLLYIRTIQMTAIHMGTKKVYNHLIIK